MSKKLVFVLFFFWCGHTNTFAQKTITQKATPSKDSLLNVLVDYDELFTDLDAFLDSLLAPKSYGVVNIGAGTGYYDYFSDQELKLQSKKGLVFTPSAGYYHKSGFGVNGTVAVLSENWKLNPYQFLTSLSYDYLRSLKFVAGVSASHFFTKESLDFYTSPLKNDLYAYFVYRDLWFKPAVSARYGWGTRKSVVEREEYLISLRKRKKKTFGFDTTRITTQENITESINDFSLMVSVRHDFYWLNVLTTKDFVRLTPQINFIGGTQTFGFNQTINTYSAPLNKKGNEFFFSENTNLDERMNFQPLAISASLRSELSIGKYFIQPQFMVNYYLPVPEKNISTAFALNTGFIF